MSQISKVLFAAAVVAIAGAPSYAQKPEWAPPVPDIEGDPASGRSKSESCATCHGEEGFSTHNYFPVLAGQTEEYLLFQLHYYRSGKRFHPLMTPLTKDLTDQDIADLSAFYASIETTKAGAPTPSMAGGLGNGHWVDLTHDFSDETISHPRGQLFVHTPSMVGQTRGGYFMSTYNYSGSEHAGTHLDAPVHFNEDGQSIDQISLDRLMGDVVVIDVKDQVASDPEYLASVGDVLAWEEAHGKIPENSIVLFNTGLASVWPDSAKYIGTEKRGGEGAAELKIPGIHKDAASLLSTERRIGVVGMDSLSFDNARQADRASHRTFFEHGIPGIENIANLDEIPPTGAYMIALPMKIRGGSGAPVRIIAFVQDSDPSVRLGASAEPLPTGWVSLFSGGNLDKFNRIGDANWQIIDNFVEADNGKHSFLVSKDHYRNFDLHVEFWPSPDANSGVFLRCQDPTAIANESCYELNIYDQHSNPDNATGSIINLAPPRVAIKAGDQWNTYDVSVRGSHIVVRLNDQVVIDFEDESFSDGPIGLQSNGGLIRFRNIRVRPLAN